MTHQEKINQILERLAACPDENLIDLILKLLLESGY